MLYIRVDANEIIATGHLMRCLSIADAARKLGEDTTFILADDGAKPLVECKGYKTIILQTPWDDMDQEIGKVLAVIRANKITRLLVDTYQVTEKYLRALSSETKVTYIDDLDKFVYPVDTLICYAAYAGKFDYPSKYPDTKLLLGTKYAPLRQEFRRLPAKEIRPSIERILLITGGTDHMNILQRILDELKGWGHITIDAICGIYNQNFSALKERYASNRNIRLHRSTDDIVSYMQGADIAISAGGTTLYELCACGTPAVSFAIADNQLDNVKSFSEKDLIKYAGDARVEDVERNMRDIIPLLSDPNYRKDISEQMQAFVDGEGAARIVEHLISCS